jgi:PAS domain S-box-containing protein
MRPSQSLRHKLPLLVCALLCVVVTLVCALAYVEVEKVLVRATGTRAAGIAQRLASMLGDSGRRLRRDALELAADPTLAAFLDRPGTTTRASAEATLQGQIARSGQNVASALWNTQGERVLYVGPPAMTLSGAPDSPEAIRTAGRAVSGARVGGLLLLDSAVAFRVSAPVLGRTRDTVGFVVSYRRLASEQSAAQIAGLIGSDATMIVGNVTGDLWTDLLRPVDGPPRLVTRDSTPQDVRVGKVRVHGVAAPIASTPWVLWIHIPHDYAIAPARRFVFTIAGIGLILIVIGATAAWVLCNRITVPLTEVSRAAQDLAHGDYSRRVAVTRSDELGSLAASFNSMAAQVEAASEGLRSHAGALEAVNMELRAGEQRFRGLLEAAHEGICAVDQAGTITYANARLGEMLGRDPCALPGRSLFEFVEPGTAARARAQYAGRMHAASETVELPFRHADGRTVWVSESVSSLFSAAGEFTGALTLLSDITERRAAEERVRSSERHFRALIENASDMICVLSDDGRLRYVSPAQERFLGYTPSDLEGQMAFDYVHPDDAQQAMAALAQVRERVGATVTARFRHQHKAGGWRELSAVATNLLDDPAVRGIVVNSHDITEEAALATQLLQSQKMEAVGQLAGGVAHDFNNLLTVMTSYSGMLLQELPNDDPMRSDVHEILRAAERAADLTRQLLAFSRQQVLEPQELDLNTVVGGIEKMLRRLLRADVRLETSLAPMLGRVHADPGQLEQVIVNLAVNARDAMPAGGELTIETAEVQLDAEYARLHPDVVPGTYVMLAVSDTGAGMDAATQARVFEPFFTTKQIGQGTGLGLSTVYGIVKQSGGHVWVYSEVGIGTTFKVYLPREAASAAEPASSDAHLVVQGGTETVLLVEDEDQVRQAAKRILERAGYTVLAAASGSEALRLSSAHLAPIDLLLTDMVMPNMSGSELAARFRELRPKASTAFMSGYAEDAVLRRVVFEPGTVFVEKPFTPEGLTTKVRQALVGV